MRRFFRVFLRLFCYATVFALVFSLFFMLSSCQGFEKNDLFVYQNATFFAEVKGILQGEPVQATVYCDRQAEGEMPCLSVSYTDPEALRGLTVSLYRDGRAEARLGELQKAGNFEMLAEPFAVLCPTLPYSRIEKKDCETVVVFENEAQALRYYFNKADVLTRIEGEYRGVRLDLLVLSIKQIK